MAAFAGRIHDDHLFLMGGQVTADRLKQFFRFAQVAADSSQLVPPAVRAGVGDGFRNDFDAVHTIGPSAQRQPDGADAGIGVDELKRFRGQECFQRVQHGGGLKWIHLEKGGGRDGVFDSSQPFINDALGAD